MSGPITSRCLPEYARADFAIVTRDLDGSAPELVLACACEARASRAYLEEVARLERLHAEGRIESARVQFLESGELTKELLIA